MQKGNYHFKFMDSKEESFPLAKNTSNVIHV